MPILCFSSIVRFIRPTQTRNYSPTATLQNCVPSLGFGFEVLVFQRYRKLNFFIIIHEENSYPFALVKTSNRSVQISPISPNYTILYTQSEAQLQLKQGDRNAPWPLEIKVYGSCILTWPKGSPTGCSHRTAGASGESHSCQADSFSGRERGLGEDASSATRNPAGSSTVSPRPRKSP